MTEGPPGSRACARPSKRTAGVAIVHMGTAAAGRSFVGYALRMSGEIHDWLTGLRGTGPPAAMLVGQALAALMSEGASLGPPLVASLAGSPPPAELAEALDRAYQDRLEQLTAVRRRVADAATLVKDIQNQAAELESAQAKLAERRRRARDAGRPEEAAEAAGKLAEVQHQAAEARRLLPGVLEAEHRLGEQSQRLQARTDAFRTRKEALKAAYTAARASLLVHEAIAAPGPAGDDSSSQQEDPGEAITEAEAKLRDVTGEIERELGHEAWPEGLTELRPGAPGDSGIRLLFAAEPPGTALLIAVLEGRQAVRDQYQDAVIASADVLRRVRAGQAPEAAVHAYDDRRSFLEELFPGSADEVDAGAAALVARNRARTLAEQRTRLGLTQAEVAQRMGVRQERVSAIERAEPGATEIRTLAAYIEALGGRLQITAEFDGENIPLR
jgi:phage shock protein A/DNA-binding XRE family transcriptional regulator